MTIWRLLQLIGAGGLVVVVLAHVAETLELFPEMGWGLPTSPGHYLDLESILGLLNQKKAPGPAETGLGRRRALSAGGDGGRRSPEHPLIDVIRRKY